MKKNYKKIKKYEMKTTLGDSLCVLLSSLSPLWESHKSLLSNTNNTCSNLHKYISIENTLLTFLIKFQMEKICENLWLLFSHQSWKKLMIKEFSTAIKGTLYFWIYSTPTSTFNSWESFSSLKAGQLKDFPMKFKSDWPM